MVNFIDLNTPGVVYQVFTEVVDKFIRHMRAEGASLRRHNAEAYDEVVPVCDVREDSGYWGLVTC